MGIVVYITKHVGMDDGQYESLWVKIVGVCFRQHYCTCLLQEEVDEPFLRCFENCVFSGPGHHG